MVSPSGLGNDVEHAAGSVSFLARCAGQTRPVTRCNLMPGRPWSRVKTLKANQLLRLTIHVSAEALITVWPRLLQIGGESALLGASTTTTPSGGIMSNNEAFLPSENLAMQVHPSHSPARHFQFDGGAGTYLGISVGAFLLTVLTLGIGTPWAICMRYRWRSQHTLINGTRVRFTGSGAGLFGNWVKWFLLCIVTLGIYGFWVAPRLTKWIVEHQTLA